MPLEQIFDSICGWALHHASTLEHIHTASAVHGFRNLVPEDAFTCYGWLKAILVTTRPWSAGGGAASFSHRALDDHHEGDAT